MENSVDKSASWAKASSHAGPVELLTKVLKVSGECAMGSGRIPITTFRHSLSSAEVQSSKVPPCADTA